MDSFKMEDRIGQGHSVYFAEDADDKIAELEEVVAAQQAHIDRLKGFSHDVLTKMLDDIADNAWTDSNYETFFNAKDALVYIEQFKV